MSANPPSSTSPQLIKCPACGASVEVADAPSVQCRYCGSSVPVPAEYRPQKPQVVIQQIATPDYGTQYAQAVKASSRTGCIITVVILVLTFGIVGYALFATTSSVQTVINTVQTGLQESGIDVQLPGSDAANTVLEFGDKGSGPGLMDDPRYVAIDSDDNIWVADYQDGRVQKFDPTGKFKLLIQVPADSNDNTLIDGLAADLQGNLYVTRGGDILKYSTADGKLLKTFPGKFPDTRYQALTVDATNTLYVLHTTASDNSLIKLDADGKTLQRWDKIVTTVNKKDAAMELTVAVDGVNNIYLSSFFGEAVYVYDKDGKYVNRFSAKKDAQDSGSPGQIVVDGKNNIYVDSFGTINHFDTSGRYLDSLPTDYTKGSPMGLTVDRQGFIYVVTNQGKVLKYQAPGK